MAHPIYSSFSELTSSQFRTYSTDLLDSYPTAAERQRAQTYLQQILAKDSVALASDQSDLNVKQQRRVLQQRILEELAVANAYDFDKTPELFTPQAKTDSEILALLQQDKADVAIRSRNITGTVNITGDDVRFIGLGASGNATDGTLECTCIVTGQIIVSGNNVKLKGLHFKTSADEAIIFGGACNGLRLVNCIFESEHSTYADAMWMYGAGNHLSDTLVVTNCLVKDFGSWNLADPTTDSGTPTTYLRNCKFEGNKFENCAGSIAIRGQQATPNKKVQFIDNLWEYGAGGQHDLYWSCIESNNQKVVVCTGNRVVGAVRKTGGTRGFLQCWSRSSVPWRLTYADNRISGFRFALQLPLIATFYSPNTEDEDHSITSAVGDISDVSYGASFVYDWLDATKTYVPENIGTFPAEPALAFAESFLVADKFAHA